MLSPASAKRVSWSRSFERIARRVSTTRSRTERESRGVPPSARPRNFVARSRSRPVSASTRNTKPRSARGKATKRPSSSRGRTSSNESDEPIARSSFSRTRSRSSALASERPSPDGSRRSSCETIEYSPPASAIHPSSAVLGPVSARSTGRDDGAMERSGGRRKTSRSSPKSSSSPDSSTRLPASRRPLTSVPLRLRRSSTAKPRPSRWSTAWCRLTEVSASATSHEGCRPTRTRSFARAIRSPRREPDRNSSAASSTDRPPRRPRAPRAAAAGPRASPSGSELPTPPSVGRLVRSRVGRPCEGRPADIDGGQASVPRPALGNGVTVARLALDQLV